MGIDGAVGDCECGETLKMTQAALRKVRWEVVVAYWERMGEWMLGGWADETRKPVMNEQDNGCGVWL